MDKEHILREIQRTAKANGGVALGWRHFEGEAGIRYYDWYGQHWTRWSDAVREAGLEPNRMSEAYDEAFLVGQLALLTRRLGHVPTPGDLLLLVLWTASRVYRDVNSLGPKTVVIRRFPQSCAECARVLNDGISWDRSGNLARIT